MSLWDTRFKTHPLWSTVAHARETMNRIQSPESAEDRDTLAYAGMVLELLERRREDSDGREISPVMLSNTHAATTNFDVYLANVESGSYTWSQLLPMVDEVVNSLGQWPPMKIGRWLSGLNSAVESFEAKTSDALDRTSTRAGAVEHDATALAEQLASLNADVSRERQRISEAIATFTTQGDEAVRNLLAEQQERITASEADWSKRLAEQQSKADEHNEQMAEYEARSLNVLGSVGVNSTATDYGAYAKTQHDAADRWRRVATAVFAMASIWFIVSSFPWFTSGATSWESSLSRLGVTAAVAGVGAYAARESSQHRKQERQAKKIQLVLIALEPFIANLPPTTQDEIRAEAARAIFVIKADVEERDEPKGTDYLDVVRSILDKVPSRPAS
jgi:hypothetical protein